MTADPRARWGMTDIRSGDWVDRCTPAAWRPYLRLARLDRPIGTWLLLFPGWWGIALAAPGQPDWRLMALFGIGAIAMRGAGCTLNDIADRDFEARGDVNWSAVLLYAGGICWTLGYDTIYAHQDKDDDALIGVKSSALALGQRTRPFLFVFYAAAVLLWAAAGTRAANAWPFWLGLVIAAAQLGWQAATVDIDDSADCLAKFRSNRFVGWFLLLGIVAAHVI